MNKYRRKPTVVDAAQYSGPEYANPGEHRPLMPGLVWMRKADENLELLEGYFPHVVSVVGKYIRVWPGDWVVRDPSGTGYYTVEKESFPVLYEAV